MLYPMPMLVLFLGSGLLVYWVARVHLLLCASKERIDETLACDLWWGRRLLQGLRSGLELDV